MAEPLGSYTFLSWLRQGIATEITRDEGQPPAPGSDPARVTVPVSITLNSSLTATVPLSLLGPGDVTGVDRDAIIRVYPMPGAFDVESNYFPLLEFDQADFLWRYTPARADSTRRLTPWLCLVVLRDEEIEAQTTAGAGLATVTVDDADRLPDLTQAWAWAHVQVSGQPTIDQAGLASLLETAPERVISRLLCPRRLEANTAYTAFLVPTFEPGRLAGLGEPVPDTLDAMTPAWGAHGAVRLPVYFQWRFGAGPAGDFEFLVRQLQARVLPDTIGKRPMDVAAPGAGLPPAHAAPLELEGALRALTMVRHPWAGPVQQTFLGRLARLLNLPAERLIDPAADRAVVPPLYGQWHAKAERLDPPAEPVWFQRLNQDPRERVAGGMGAQVVQQQQRQLMAGAWRQVEGIREANQRLRYTQLARELASRLYTRHLAVHDADELLQVTAPVLGRMLASPITIRERLRNSPVLTGVLEPSFRRIARARGPLGRRQGRDTVTASSTLLSRLNRGEVRGTAAPVVPEQLTTPATAGPAAPAGATDASVAALADRARWLRTGGAVLLVVGLIVALVISVVAGLLLAGAGVSAYQRGRSDAARAAETGRILALRAGRLTAEQVRSVTPPDSFVPMELADGASLPDPAAPVAPGDTATSARVAAASAFRSALADMVSETATPIEAPPALEAASLRLLRQKVAAGLAPRDTVVAGIRDRLHWPVRGDVRQPTTDPVEPVMAAPVFPQPMYAPLAALSQDWMLPGLDRIPANTVTTALTNPRFIEAYMVGLNHEMARELQWNEYPTDMRGSYFRQFWDAAGAGTAASDLPDITPLHTWLRGSDLGGHPVRPPAPGGGQLVLLVRGEVFRRYPNTVVYAVKARAAAGGVHELTDEELLPVFSGRLPPDVAFFGFDLTAEAARGEVDPASPRQGWFFVLQEQPSEPRFGLDIPEAPGGRPAGWSELSWGHLAADEAGLGGLTYIDLTDTLPDTSQVAAPGGAHWHAAEGARSADLAFITLQQPMRVAVHGSDMVPPPAP